MDIVKPMSVRGIGSQELDRSGSPACLDSDKALKPDRGGALVKQSGRRVEIIRNESSGSGEMSRKRFSFLLSISLLLSSFASPPALLAQSEAGGENDAETIEALADPDLVEVETPDQAAAKPEYGGIEEILVTAEKRSSTLQETPTAITALSGAQLFDRAT